MSGIDRLCAVMHEQGASDLFLSSNQVPQIRLNGDLITLESEAFSDEEMNSFWERCGVPENALDHDTSYISADGQRYRVNFFHSLYTRGAVLRQIKTQIPELESLGLPEDLLKSWVVRRSGLILVTGATGSGKSTTLASCLDYLNHHYPRHVVTIEDPVEYLFSPDQCLFTQREVGTDTTSFAEGLRRSLRQSPDVILLGEIRDGLTASTALQAAETGHLVLATLHSSNVLDSLERLARLFDQAERAGVLQVLSQQLIGILSQKLIASASGGQVLAVEHVENQAATRKWILEGKFQELADFLAKGTQPSNISFVQSLYALVKSGQVTEETALHVAPNPHELQRLIRGIGNSAVNLSR